MAKTCDPSTKRDNGKAPGIFVGGCYWGGVGRFDRMNPIHLVSALYDQNGNPIITWRNFATLILNVTPERRPGSFAGGVARGWGVWRLIG